jgi:hypothetical protein
MRMYTQGLLTTSPTGESEAVIMFAVWIEDMMGRAEFQTVFGRPPNSVRFRRRTQNTDHIRVQHKRLMALKLAKPREDRRG